MDYLILLAKKHTGLCFPSSSWGLKSTTMPWIAQQRSNNCGSLGRRQPSGHKRVPSRALGFFFLLNLSLAHDILRTISWMRLNLLWRCHPRAHRLPGLDPWLWSSRIAWPYPWSSGLSCQSLTCIWYPNHPTRFDSRLQNRRDAGRSRNRTPCQLFHRSHRQCIHVCLPYCCPSNILLS